MDEEIGDFVDEKQFRSLPISVMENMPFTNARLQWNKKSKLHNVVYEYDSQSEIAVHVCTLDKVLQRGWTGEYTFFFRNGPSNIKRFSDMFRWEWQRSMMLGSYFHVDITVDELDSSLYKFKFWNQVDVENDARKQVNRALIQNLLPQLASFNETSIDGEPKDLRVSLKLDLSTPFCPVHEEDLDVHDIRLHNFIAIPKVDFGLQSFHYSYEFYKTWDSQQSHELKDSIERFDLWWSQHFCPWLLSRITTMSSDDKNGASTLFSPSDDMYWNKALMWWRLSDLCELMDNKFIFEFISEDRIWISFHCNDNNKSMSSTEKTSEWMISELAKYICSSWNNTNSGGNAPVLKLRIRAKNPFTALLKDILQKRHEFVFRAFTRYKLTRIDYIILEFENHFQVDFNKIPSDIKIVHYYSSLLNSK